MKICASLKIARCAHFGLKSNAGACAVIQKTQRKATRISQLLTNNAAGKSENRFCKSKANVTGTPLVRQHQYRCKGATSTNPFDDMQ